VIKIKTVFKVNDIDFQAELGDSQAARDIIKKLPLSCAVFIREDGIYCELGVVVGTFESATTQVNPGDLAFCPSSGYLHVFLMPGGNNSVNRPVLENPVIIVGKTSGALDICRRIKPGDKVNISILEETKSLDRPDPASDSRKLSQTEIDDLVKRLLEERKKKNG